MTGGAWDFWIDRGGTFTDVVARRPDGGIMTRKLLSESPGRYDDAAIEAIKEFLGAGGTVGSLRIGTTVATNALLERRGEPTVLVITKGFADALRIGTQARPDIFALRIERPDMLYEDVVEIDERMTADGAILREPDPAEIRAALMRCHERGLRAAAIVFLHGYKYPRHERIVEDIAREIGFSQISASHRVNPLIKLVPRGDTTVADAYLTPALRRYVDRLSGGVGVRPLFMQSNGGLIEGSLFQGKDAILSGPAGGVIGAVKTSAEEGIERLIGFDMGGTSTDVWHYAGEFERRFDSEIAGIRIRAPMMSIHTVAAGGGSLLDFDGDALRVGPRSAGADPGPACYRRGGPLTVTDANLVAGKLNADFFPALFGAEGRDKLDAEAARRAFDALAARVPGGRTVEQLADAFIAVAVQNMAAAIKRISVERGYDLGRYALACFGGAAGQHACLVADALGMDRIVIHPLASLLSAYGMGLAELRALRERGAGLTLDAEAETHAILDALGEEAASVLLAQGVPAAEITILRHAHIRYRGSDIALIVPAGSPAEMRAAFEAAHLQRYGFAPPDQPLIIETLAVEAIGGGMAAGIRTFDSPPMMEAGRTRFFSDGRWHDAPIAPSAALEIDRSLSGPALVVEPHSTIVVEEGWSLRRSPSGMLILSRVHPRRPAAAIGRSADPMWLSIFGKLFMSIAEQMGAVLESTAQSVNIKERLDFSCAIFDAAGGLVANAPHMPVHLGSMGESVGAILEANRGRMRGGDVFLLNAPYRGGTHLPDLTVIAPVFIAGGSDPDFFVAARGHHADIGGISPASMPPASTSVEEEGVLFDNFKIVDDGRFLECEIRAALAAGRYPARQPDQNIGDLKAQIAACRRGIRELEKLCADYGLETVARYMGHVQDQATNAVRRVIERLKDGHFELTMDDGGAIKVTVAVDRAKREATIDFTGSAPQRASNFNAPKPVTMAAVLYVFRCLVEDDIPLNAGCLKPLHVIVPEGSMLNPNYPAAVAAGNVETSQAITDALFGALGVMAAAQGTMNNLTFGNARYQYYETICGGSGAGAAFDGADAVQTHMTNSRLTDAEILETRFPVRVETFAIRRGSGGAGRRCGGDGVIRRIAFEEPMTVAILANRRLHRPFGLAGGKPGLTGETWIERRDGSKQALDFRDETEVEKGDAILVLTPGGGGYGE